MININLLPPELKQKRITNKKNATLIGSCVVIILVMIIISVLSYSFRSTINSSLKTVQDDIEKNNALLEGDSEIENLALFINDRATTADTIDKTRAIWSQVLQELNNSVPSTVQFENLAANSDKSPNFTLQGNTTSEREIIKFKEKLENSVLFKNVSFKSANLSSIVTQANKLSFTIDFELEKNSFDTVSDQDKEVK